MQAKATVDVSMVIANFNNGRYLESFFQSIQNSTRMPREIIFVDDGSTDDSLVTARRASHALENLKIVELPKNLGFANCVKCRDSGILRYLYHANGP